MTTDKHCYECKVRYKDPKPQDLVMYLHAWKYKVSFDVLEKNNLNTHTYSYTHKKKHRISEHVTYLVALGVRD